MTRKVEYIVRPIQRFELHKFTRDDNSAGVETVGEYTSQATAEAIAEALRAKETN